MLISCLFYFKIKYRKKEKQMIINTILEFNNHGYIQLLTATSKKANKAYTPSIWMVNINF